MRDFMARRSKNSQRLANRRAMMSGSPVGAPRSRGGRFDWIVSGASVDNTGTPNIGSAIWGSWSLSNTGGPGTIASGSFITNQAVLIQPTPMTSTPSIGKLAITRITGSIRVVPNITATNFDTFSVVVGMYVADLNNTTTKWEVRNPLTPTDVARDDYIYLQAKTMLGANLPASVATTPYLYPALCFDFDLNPNIILSGGQALHVTVGAVSLGSQASTAFSSFRTMVGSAA